MSMGWIKLHRSFLDWEWYHDKNVKIAFLHMLLRASHNKRRFKGKEFAPGQLPMGLGEFSSEIGLSIQEFRTVLSKLKSTNEITTQSSSKGTVITIVNWDKYQAATSEPTRQQQTSNKRATTTKNVKNVKNVNNPIADEVIDYLNQRTGKSYKPNGKKTRSLINSRLNEGYKVEDFKQVIDNKVSDWQGDSYWAKFLRPETLFSNKFESYLNESVTNTDIQVTNTITGKVLNLEDLISG